MDLKFTAISDTHERHSKLNLSGGDFLIHSGDQTSRGADAAIMDFLKWTADQDYSHKIIIPGNHDFGYEKDFLKYKDVCEKLGIHLLCDDGVVLEGIKFWGSPMTPWFHDWAFNRHRGADIKFYWDMIPKDTEVLITHGPPFGILDKTVRTYENVGCRDLLEKILQTEVKLHVFGHIHEGRGFTYHGDKTYVNASSLDARYDLVNRHGVPIRREEATGDYIVEQS